MAIVFASGHGNHNVPCKGCVKNPCAVSILLKEVCESLNAKTYCIGLDVGVIQCGDRVPYDNYAIGSVVKDVISIKNGN